MLIFVSIFILILLSPILLFLKFIYFPCLRMKQKKQNHQQKTFGIFHPYSNGGGGGERVLWCLIKSIQMMSTQYHIVLYTGEDGVMPYEQLKTKVKHHFNIELDREITMIGLKSRNIIERAGKWRFTLISQSLASMIVGWEALRKFTPDIFFDSMGFAFTFPLAKLAGAKVGCYVHYPTISTDMLSRIERRVTAYNNDTSISGSGFKTSIKILYYRIFSKIYGFMGYFADLVLVNSTWTYQHISQMWFLQKNQNTSIRNTSHEMNQYHNLHIVYPPVNVDHLLNIELNPDGRKPYILSVGQFREEKDHPLQLKAFANLLQKLHKDESTTDGHRIANQVKLCLLGGSRDESDNERVRYLKQLAKELNIEGQVEFQVNATFEKLYEMLSKSIIGLHTMWNEHFGICVCEYMAAGLIPIAHDSGGPKTDIIKDGESGYLASDEQSYADKMHFILCHYFANETEEKQTLQLRRVQQNARKQSQRFREEDFIEQTQNHLKSHLLME